MIKWPQLSIPECFTQNPDLIYITPYNNGSKIWFKGEECFIENATIMDIIDQFNAIGCTSFQFSKEDIEAAIEKFEKENNHE